MRESSLGREATVGVCIECRIFENARQKEKERKRRKRGLHFICAILVT
jgi:hypothetical protein